jgi:hypothetical protein
MTRSDRPAGWKPAATTSHFFRNLIGRENAHLEMGATRVLLALGLD